MDTKKIKHTSDIDPDIYEKFIPENLNYSLERKLLKRNHKALQVISKCKDSVKAIMMIRVIQY